MSWARDGFVAVDWGSSARRCYRLDAGGRVVDEMEDAVGALTVPAGGFPAEMARLRARFGDVRFLMAGMVGSNRGWSEAPYLPCPATLADVAARLHWVEPGRVAIVPGLSLVEHGRADVMRGEEVQVFGVPLTAPATICHPGTHTKWIEADTGRLIRFRTVMTGELFALLQKHSVLAELLVGAAMPGEAFARGVERGYTHAEITADLFGVRAGVLLGIDDRGDAPSFVSGLLIGADLRAGLASVVPGERVIVLGRGSLTDLYATAIRQCGFEADEADGATAFIAGICALAELAS